MKKYDFKSWLKAALVRAIKTMAQTAVSLITVGNMVTEMDWVAITSISLTAGITSILTSIAGLPEVEEKSAE
jgi:hypothetical protein